MFVITVSLQFRNCIRNKRDESSKSTRTKVKWNLYRKQFQLRIFMTVKNDIFLYILLLNIKYYLYFDK